MQPATLPLSLQNSGGAPPGPNTAAFTVSNQGDALVTCEVFRRWHRVFRNRALPPRSGAKTTVTLAAAPSGYYTTGWSRRRFAKAQQSFVIGGTANPSAQPHVVPNAAPSDPFRACRHCRLR